MGSEFVTTASIRDGQFRVRNKPAFDKFLKGLREGTELTVTIEKAHATRSVEQNRLYHVAYVKPLAEHTGCTTNEMHEYLKQRFLPVEKRKTKTLLLHNQHGEVIDEREIDLSTTTALNKVEFGEYLKEIEQFAIELGVTVGSNREDAA